MGSLGEASHSFPFPVYIFQRLREAYGKPGKLRWGLRARELAFLRGEAVVAITGKLEFPTARFPGEASQASQRICYAFEKNTISHGKLREGFPRASRSWHRLQGGAGHLKPAALMIAAELQGQQFRADDGRPIHAAA